MSYNNVDVNKNNIFKYRRSKKLTQDNIATYLGIKRSTYARQELTGHMPRQQLQKLADLFGVTVFDLLGETSLQFFQPFPRENVSTPSLTNNESNIIKIYRCLDQQGKQEFEKALCRIAGLDNDKTKKE